MKFGWFLETRTGPDIERGVTGVTSLQDSADGDRLLVAQVCRHRGLVRSKNRGDNGVGL